MEKCLYSKYCGGCSYQGVEYKEQLTMKHKSVSNLFNGVCDVNDIIGMQDPYNYRNKMQVSLGYDEKHNVIYGNYVTSTHTIVPIDNCNICNAKANEIINSIVRITKKLKISIFDENVMKGCLRHILVRCTNTNQYMVILVTGSSNIIKKDQLIKEILFYNKEVTTIIQNINNSRTSMVLGKKNIVLYGKGYIIDNLLGLSFKISPNSFYQVNSRQTETLYKEAIKAASLNKNDILIDAYCGTGTIGLACSKYVYKVIGVEINKSSILDALNNAKYNHINNAEFICADASRFMNDLAYRKTRIDVVIMDPPRSGADIKFLKALSFLKPQRIIYISCNPNTLKDNLLFLNKFYDIESLTPVDMFPFTDHVECCLRLTRR